MAARVRLCGPLRVEIAGTAIENRLQGRKGRLAFAYLALHRERAVSRDELMGVLWGDEDQVPATPDAALSTILSRLRTAIAPAQLVGRDQLSLELVGACEIDWEVAQRASSAAAEALASGDSEQATAFAQQAVVILERPFLPGVGGRWAEERRREQQSLRVLALETIGRAGLQAGGAELATAEAAARALVDIEPYRESGHALLMETHAARGNVAEALRVFHELREFLREELGVAPAAEVTALNARLLAGEQPAIATAAPAAPPPKPRREPESAPRVPSPETRFVGRAGELARLREHLDAVIGGDARLVVLSGEPGIGKTRLVVELMQAAEGAGARILYGGGDADAVLSYQPVAEALHAYVASALDDLRAAGLDAELAELARLMPDVGIGTGPPDQSADPDVQRFRLFQSVAATFAHAAADRPLLLVLDDLQWADRSTREMLSHLLRASEVPHSLVVAIHRQDAAAELASMAQRYRSVDHIELTGLAEDDSRELVLAHMPDASDLLVRRLVDQTQGNPFFLEELLRSIRDGQSNTLEDAEVPPGIRFVVSRRLEHLGEDKLKVLRAASVAGTEFELGVLDRALAVGTEVVLDAVEAALAARVVVEDDVRPDHFAFSHALVRGTLYRSQSASRRMRLHLAIGTALEELASSHPGELGHHFWEARHVGGAERAARHLAAAGRLADEALAWEDAARLYEQALDATEIIGEGRAELLLALGDASEHSGDSARAKRVFLEAAELARARGDPELLSLAALGYGRAPGDAFGADATLLALLDEALAALGDTHGVLRARVLGRLAVERASADSGADDVDALSAEAVMLAEEHGDDVVLAVALASRHWTLSAPDKLLERCEVARRSLDLAVRAGDRERELAGREWWLFDLVELGDLVAAEEQLARYDALAGSFRHPSYAGYSSAMHAMLALLRGEYTTAGTLIEAACEQLGRALDPDAERVYALQRFVLHIQQGEPALAAQALDAMTGPRPIWTCLRAWAWTALGDRERSAHALPDPRDIPVDGEWLVSMSALAHAVAGLGDAGTAAVVAPSLERFADRMATVGGIVCLGSVAYPAGRLARLLDRADDADRLLQLALRRNTDINAKAAVDSVRRELAHLSGPPPQAAAPLRNGGT